MRYKDLLRENTKVLGEDDGGGATTSGDVATFVGYLGYEPPKKRRKQRKPIVLRRPK